MPQASVDKIKSKIAAKGVVASQRHVLLNALLTGLGT